MSRKYTSHDDIVRVIEDHKLGLKTSEISQNTGILPRTVQNIVRRFKDGGGVKVPAHGHGGGRARSTVPRTLNLLKREIDCNPTLTARKLKEQHPSLLGGASVRTVQRVLHDDLGYRKVRARKKPLINDSQRKRRVLFAKEHKVWNLESWKMVLWSDEATFRVSDTSGQRVWRARDSDPLAVNRIAAAVRHPQHLMVWGSFGYGGLGDLVILPQNETVTKESYYIILNEHLESSFEKSGTDILQQDGAPPHTAKLIKHWLSDCGINFITDWPANSPDLSPIENLWAIIKARLREKDTSSLPKLEVELRRAWESLDPDHLKSLAESLPKRLKEVLKRNGNPISISYTIGL